jgi:hypothetical protein
VRPRAFDVFAAAATLTFLLFAAFLHYDMWVDAGGGGVNAAEFFVYSTGAALAVWVLWLLARRYPWPAWELALVGAGFMLHVAGGFVTVDGARLYEQVLFGLRFDKPVHFINAAIAARFTADMLRFEGISLGRLHRLLVVLIVLGLGAMVEITEYLVVRSIPDVGVGFYHNNMQDLIANLGGSALSTLVFPAGTRRRAGSSADAEAAG